MAEGVEIHSNYWTCEGRFIEDDYVEPKYHRKIRNKDHSPHEDDDDACSTHAEETIPRSTQTEISEIKIKYLRYRLPISEYNWYIKIDI